MLENYFNKPKLVADMQRHYPNSLKDYSSILDTYLRAVRAYCWQGINLATDEQIKSNQIPFAWEQVRKSCGNYGKRNQTKQWWFDWIQENNPLVKCVKKGSKFGAAKGKLTMVETTIPIEYIIACDDPIDAFEMTYEKYADELLDPKQTDWIPIDQISLENFIFSSEEELNTEMNDDKRKEYTRNLKQARHLMLISRAHKKSLMPNVIKESAFGRKYYQGFNLQSMSKIVREAALGDCYSYDIENSVFAWKLNAVKQYVDINFKMPETLEYLDHKKQLRLQVAEHVFKNDPWPMDYKVGVIKQAITAIGFGARATSASWRNENGVWTTTALRDIIKDPQRLQKFLTHYWVKAFIAEQNAINKKIGSYIQDGLKDVKELYNDRGNFSVNKAISYCYQHDERAMVEKLLDIAGRDNVLLLVHDGFYTKNKSSLIDMNKFLSDNNEYARLECKKITRYRFYDHSDEIRHKQHIIDEERKARSQDPNHQTSVGFKPKLKKPEFNREYDSGGGWDEQRSYDYQMENYQFEEYDAETDDAEYLKSRQTKWF